jgi:hypothetical protein
MISRLFAHPAREIKANCEFFIVRVVASPKKLLLCGEVIGHRHKSNEQLLLALELRD